MNWTEDDYMSPEQEREQEAREECARRGIDPDDVCADGGILAWMVVDQELRQRPYHQGTVDRVISELRDRRLLNDVDDDLHREIAIALIKAAEPILAPAECNCDDPDCPKRHWSLTLRQAYENAIARLREAEAGLRSWEITAKRISEEETRQSTCDQCPKCGGDCSAANPPVYDCPMVGCNKDF